MRSLMVFGYSLILMCGVVTADDYSPAQRSQDETIIEAVLRIDGFDLNTSAKGKEAVLRWCRANPATPRFFELVKRFKIHELDSELLAAALARPTETEGVEAARLLIEHGGVEKLKSSILGEDPVSAEKAITVVGLVGAKEVGELLLPLIGDAARNVAVRSAAVKALGRSVPGQKSILEMVEMGTLPGDLTLVAAGVLHASADEAVRTKSLELIKLPETKDSQPLPPLAELVKMPGDIGKGQEVFRTIGTCAKCHKVQGQGSEVGPDLSEIGSKLSREAMLVSILDPSAAVSHNYESYQAILADGTVFAGIKVSETDDAVTLRSAEAIVRTIPNDDIEELIKQKVSLMPAGLQKLMTVQELADVVEYLGTLKKPE